MTVPPHIASALAVSTAVVTAAAVLPVVLVSAVRTSSIARALLFAVAGAAAVVNAQMILPTTVGSLFVEQRGITIAVVVVLGLAIGAAWPLARTRRMVAAGVVAFTCLAVAIALLSMAITEGGRGRG